jgi:hypothetical protein
MDELNRKSGDKSLFQTTIVMLVPGSMKQRLPKMTAPLEGRSSLKGLAFNDGHARGPLNHLQH